VNALTDDMVTLECRLGRARAATVEGLAAQARVARWLIEKGAIPHEIEKSPIGAVVMGVLRMAERDGKGAA
jgi:hypothetical protein